MWLILQQEEPDDYVIATGEMHSVREFVELAFRHINRTIQWKGTGTDEKGYDAQTDQILVTINPKYFRPTEVVRYRLSFLIVSAWIGFYLLSCLSYRSPLFSFLFLSTEYTVG